MNDTRRPGLTRRDVLRLGVAARFADESLEVGTVERAAGRLVFLLNWSDAPRTLSFTLDRPQRLAELWSGEDLGTRTAGPVSLTLPAHAGRVLVCTAAA